MKKLVPELKITLFTSMSAVTETLVMLEVANVAVSAKPLGTVAGVQLLAMFQLLLGGAVFQVALPAKDWAAINHEKTQMTGKSLFMLRSQQKLAAISRQYGDRELGESTERFRAA